ncbi:hypothetical protein GOP47_0010686 [Adiantum capillus-veneris]|uniref:Serine-threonine/tyrosine-protein kinase catalytic domain-containing protein n=1 Tax=Adiantum capillus-veneris TaxID=13818 RepID=A0A9D4ZJ13_ADICA|nr:hypothetical protein GOP47_0010686 [Adiantum capillus-veneris]
MHAAFGFPDDKLSGLIEQQVHCWSHIISRYIGIGAELLDHKDLASTGQPNIKSGLNSNLQTESLFGNIPSVANLLSCRLKWALSRDRMRENQVDILLEDLKIDSEELQFENRPGPDEETKERQSFAKASWAGIPVSIKWCRSSYLGEHASLLVRMRNPFILQLIGWTEVADEKGLSCCMVMEDVQTDLESFIRAKAESNPAHNEEQQLLFPFSVALDMMLQIARGMWYLHRNGIAHRSLQSGKVLLCRRDHDGAGRLKLCHGLSSFAQTSNAIDYAADVLSFGILCREILTGKKAACTNTDFSVEIQLPTSTPVLLSDCLKACCDSKPQNRPEFGVICGLLRHLKLIVSNPRHLERLLYLNEAAKASSKPPLTDSVSPLIKGTGIGVPDDMNMRVQLIDINVRLLHASTPPDLYPLVATESWSGNPPIMLSTLVDISSQFTQNLQFLNAQEIGSAAMQPKFVIANPGTLKTSLVMDGCQGLLKSGWANTTLGVGTLEMWLQFMSPEWKDIQKVALGVALCLRHVSRTPPKIGFYSQELENIDGFYPIYPNNIVLNNQLKVALLLDNSPPAWKGLVQWAGIHPQVGEGADNILISIEAYTTFYFGHLLSFILKVRHSKINKLTTSLDQHFEFVLTNLAMRCIQLKYLSMTEVVTILLSDNKPH